MKVPFFAIVPSVSGSSSFFEINQDKTVNELKEEIKKLKTEIDQLSKNVKDTAGTGQRVDGIENQLANISQSISRVEEKGNEIEAEVILPPPEEMSVHLVSSASLERLEEYRSDLGIAYLIIGIIAGFIANFVVNWLSSANISGPGIVIVSLFVVFIACIFWAARESRRVATIRDRMIHKIEAKSPGNLHEENVRD